MLPSKVLIICEMHVEDLNADKTAGISEIDSAVPADYKQRALLDLWRFWI